MTRRWAWIILSAALSLWACAAPARPDAALIAFPSPIALDAPTAAPSPAPSAWPAGTITPTVPPNTGVWPALGVSEVEITPAPPRLLIPKLEIDQLVVNVPIREGAWEIDALGAQVGWLTTAGQRPGGDLAPVLIGHVSLENGASGPFGYLWKLKPGDEIIYLWQGQPYEYRVEAKHAVRPDDVGQIYVPDGNRLLLITCDGWDFTQWAYTRRLMVQAVLAEGSTPAPPDALW